MKIIKKGTPPKEQEFKGNCIECDSVLEAIRAELRMTKGDYRTDHKDFGHAKCPVCGFNNVVFYQKEQ